MNSSVWYFPLSALVNAVGCIVLGFYLFFTNFDKKIVRNVVYMCIAPGLWSLAYFFWQISASAEWAFFWCKILMFWAILIPITYLQVVLMVLQLETKKFFKTILVFIYAVAFFWIGANFTDLIVSGIGPISYFKFWPVAGKLYVPFLVYFFGLFIFAFILLFYTMYKTKDAAFKKQLAILLVGVLFAFIGGSTNYPLWFGINIAPWGNGLIILYILFTIYGIMRYKMLSIKAVTAELFTVIVIIVALVDIFLSKSYTEAFYRVAALVIMVMFGKVFINLAHQDIKHHEETVRLTEVLEKANLRLQEMDRQKTDFLSIAAHQLRTPLSILKGYIELIHDGGYGKVPKGVKEVLNNMDESNNRLVVLVDEFLNITRIEQGRVKYDYKPTDLRDVVDSVIKELLDRAAQKDMKLVWHMPREKYIADVDDEKIRHVVFNFVDNAIKYSDQGDIKVSLEKDAEGMTVRVKDSGLGFEKIDQVNFFQKFYRGKNVQCVNVNGTGLGLFVCRLFIEAHQGRIWALSPGLKKGSEFGFWVPTKRK